MGFTDIIKKSVIDGFNASDISLTSMAIVLLGTFIIGLYIFFVYRYLTRSTFYNKGFAISMAIISVVTAGIVLAMQSNLVISLGMVGALSIVRFRTAIKEPMDLLFLFWSIGSGIICGAGLFELTIVLALVITIGLLVMQLIPVTQSPEILVLKLSEQSAEATVLDLVKKYSPKYKVDSKAVAHGFTTLVIEVKAAEGSKLVDEVAAVAGVSNATLMHHEGEIKY